MFNFLKKIDDEEEDTIHKALIAQYFYTMQVASMFPNLRPKWRFFSVIYFFAVTGTLIYFLFLLFQTASRLNDLNMTAQVLHFASLVTLSLIIIFSFNSNRSAFVQYLRLSAKGYFSYGDDFEDEQIGPWIKENRSFKIKLLILVPTYLGCCVLVAIVLTPIIDEYQGFVLKDDYINGVYMKVPVPLWYPHAINTLFERLASYGFQLCGAFMLASIIGCADLIIIFECQNISLQMKILIKSIQKIEERSLKLYNKHFKTTITNPKLLFSDKEYLKKYGYCLKETVEHHKVIIRAFSLLYDLQKWPVFFAVLMGSILVALALLGVAMGETRIGPQVLSLLLLVAEVLNMAMLCSFGQAFIDLSEDIFDSLYEIGWIDLSQSLKRSMMIIRERAKQPMILKAGGITPLNMETFSMIMNSAYSYFNIVYATLTQK